jgi:glycosyltransferase involved in cell wall biosynthesis
MPPRVTVFIPTYNRAHFLAGAVESVLAQTYDDFRLEVSDNASTDETPEVVKGFSDPRLVYRRQPENLGLLGNHNQFLRRVDTAYALILPDDDRLGARLLAETVAALDRHPRAGMVHTEFEVIDAAGQPLQGPRNWTYGLTEDTVESAERFIRESMKWSCRVCASTALMRTAALPPGRMCAPDFPAVDLGMWLRMAAGGWDVAFLARRLGNYRVHGGSHSAAFGPLSGPGYVQGVEIVAKLYDVKRRFLERYEPDRERRKDLIRLARASRRRELLLMVRNLTLPQRKRIATLRLLGDAARTAPDLVGEPLAWRLAAASLVGPGLVERARIVTRAKKAA